jgi:uncharacterized protein YjbI with pentapeptide repeats
MRAVVAWARRHPLADLVIALSVAIGLVAAALLIAQPWGIGPLAAELARLQSLDAAHLGDEKLRQEIAQLAAANLTSASPWGSILTIVPVLTATLGGLAVLATIWKQITERSDQLRQDRDERERELQGRQSESFKRATENLSAASPSLRASAAALLTTFLRPEYAAYRDELLLVSIAKSKPGMEDNPSVSRLITRAVELALRAALPSMAPADRRFFLDLSRTQLKRIDLSDLDLTEVDVAYADLREARLMGARLFRARGFEVRLDNARLGASSLGPTDLREARLKGAIAPEAQFHQARCISIRLEDADLTKAEFFDAELQEAHFERAILTGATFHGANLNNAFFQGATLDESALRSIATGAHHWAVAHFDPEPLRRLKELSKPGAARPAKAAAGAPAKLAAAAEDTPGDENRPGPDAPPGPAQEPMPGSAPA